METEHNEEIRVFKYRWIILSIFCFYSAINFIQFLQYSIIANITKKYYNIDDTLVDLTGLVFMISFIIFCLPASYIIDKYNLRIISLISTALTTCGNLVKIFSVARDRFYVVIIGQTLCAIAQVFMLSIPSKLASTWFGPNEVSTACAIAILGTQIGVALGCIFPTAVVKNSDDFEQISQDFTLLNTINSSITTASFITVVLFFRSKPLSAPSRSQLIEKSSFNLKEVIIAMVHNKNYLFLLLAVGSTNGMYTGYGILINTVYLHYFPDSEEKLGIISAVSIIAGGCIGSVIFGYFLDKYHHFKLTSFGLIITSASSYVFLALSLELKSQISTFFTIPIYGFFMGSVLLVGFEFATELMYPVSEAAACSILNATIYIFSIIYTLLLNYLFYFFGYIPTHCVVTILLGVGSIFIHFISPNLRRREANIKS